MADPRSAQLARTIVRHSCRLQAGETILIEAFDLADGLVYDLIDESFAVGGIPIVYLRDNRLNRKLLLHAGEAQLLDAFLGVFPHAARALVGAAGFPVLALVAAEEDVSFVVAHSDSGVEEKAS